jgi:hydrogenase maturation protease
VKAPLVIGFGNPLRGDDGAAHRVLRAIEARRAVRCLAVHQLTMDLAEDVARSGGVVFVDASMRVQVVAVGRIEAGGAPMESHVVAPAQVLAAAAALYGEAPPAWLVEIPASALGYGEGLSARTAAAVGEAVGRVEALLTSPT